MEFERDELMGLPSIDFDTDPEELYEIYLKIEEIDNSSHPELQSVAFWDNFERYSQIRIAVSLNLATQEEITKALESILKDPDIADLVDISRFWFGLKNEFPDSQLDFSDAQLAWKNGIDQETEIFQKINQIGQYVADTDLPNELDDVNISLIEDAAESLRLSLPPPEDVNKLEHSDISKALGFLRSAKRIGIRFGDLEEYFLNALTNIDVVYSNGYTISSLLRHVCDSDIDIEIKKTRVKMCAIQAEKMDEGIHSKDNVLRSCVRCFLELDMFDEAVLTWNKMTEPTHMSHPISDFVEYAFKKGYLDRVRNLLPEFIKKSHRGLETPISPRIEDQYKSRWSLMWYFAGAHLTEHENTYALDIPEVVEFIASGGADFDLSHLISVACAFPDKLSGNFVFEKLMGIIKQFNLGKLDSYNSKELVESLIILKSKNIRLPSKII
jgi:hypothetical protein